MLNKCSICHCLFKIKILFNNLLEKIKSIYKPFVFFGHINSAFKCKNKNEILLQWECTFTLRLLFKRKEKSYSF